MLPILLAIVFIAILFIIVIAGRPDEFVVSRSTTISAPPEEVFAHVNDLHKWEAWNPWGKLDPAMKMTYEGPQDGIGAVHSWAGNRKVGEGRMTIIESRPGNFIRFKLEFLKPFQATNIAEFNFKPEGNQTVVSWTMTGNSNFFFKVFSLFRNCDNLVGKDFEKGLAAMKSAVETARKN